MKRTLLTAVSVCLILASIFGIFAVSAGMDDISQILRFKKSQKADILGFVEVLDGRVAEVRKNEAERAEDEKEFAESVVTDDIGGEQLSQGQQEYNAGADRISRGQAEYDEAEKLYNSKLAEYNAAEQRLADAEDQLAEAKLQRDAGQAKLDAATPAYEKAKPVYDAINLIPGSDAIAAFLAKHGYTSIQELKDAIKEYEDGQAQLAEANARIAEAEQEIADGKAQLAEAKAQLDKGKAQLDEAKAQLDSGRAQLADAKNQLSAGQAQLNDNVEKMNGLKDQLTKYDDAEAAVTTGIAALMEIEGIADRVSDESDYESVLEAAKEYAEEDAENLTRELDLRKSLNSTLRILSLAAILAGAVGLAAALRPNGKKLLAALIASGVAAVGAAAANIYGFTNGYQYFVSALSAGSGDGSLQRVAILVLLAVSLITAVLAAVCTKAYNGAFASGAPDVMPVPPADVAGDDYDDDDMDDEEDDDGDEAESARPRRAAAPSDISELEAKTRRLNEETERLEREARLKEYEAAQREYEEALKKYEEARRKAGK